MKRLAFLAVLLLPLAAHAQCAGGLIGNCPAAVSPQNTDIVLGWQPGQNPHTRAFTLGQIATQVGSNFLPLTGGSLSGSLSVTGTAALNGGASVTGALSIPGYGNMLLLGTSSVSNATNIIAEGNQPIGFQSGSNGYTFVLNGAASSATGRLNLSPGVSDAPIIFDTGNSSFTDTSVVFKTFGTQAQFILNNNSLTGTYTAPASSTYNCSGEAGAVLICDPNGDTVAYGYSSGPAGMDQFRVYHQFGGSGTTGSREVGDFILNLNAATSDTQGAFYQALRTETDVNATAGGTSGAYKGDFFSGNSYAYLNGNYYIHGLSAWEYDLEAVSGSHVHEVGGLSVVLLAANAVGGDYENYGYTISAQSGATPTITVAYGLNDYDGVNPLAATAYIMQWIQNQGSDTGPTITGGIDFSHLTFTGDSWNDGHIQFTGAGEIIASALPTSAPSTHCAVWVNSGVLTLTTCP